MILTKFYILQIYIPQSPERKLPKIVGKFTATPEGVHSHSLKSTNQIENKNSSLDVVKPNSSFLHSKTVSNTTYYYVNKENMDKNAASTSVRCFAVNRVPSNKVVNE